MIRWIRALPGVIAALDRAGLVEGYEDGDEPAPGLRLRSAPGHRLGHSILEIGESLVHWDCEPEVALATRGTILIELAESGSKVATNHFASPGRIERAGDGLRGSCSCRPVQYASVGTSGRGHQGQDNLGKV